MHTVIETVQSRVGLEETDYSFLFERVGLDSPKEFKLNGLDFRLRSFARFPILYYAAKYKKFTVTLDYVTNALVEIPYVRIAFKRDERFVGIAHLEREQDVRTALRSALKLLDEFAELIRNPARRSYAEERIKHVNFPDVLKDLRRMKADLVELNISVGSLRKMALVSKAQKEKIEHGIFKAAEKLLDRYAVGEPE